MNGNIESVSIAGAPTIEFRFAGDTVTAELAGARLYAEVTRVDDEADLRVTDADGFVLANLVVKPCTEVNLTENVIAIGSALLWSYWRFRQAKPPMSGATEKHADDSLTPDDRSAP